MDPFQCHCQHMLNLVIRYCRVHRPHLLSIRYPSIKDLITERGGFKYQGSVMDETESTKNIHFHLLQLSILRSYKCFIFFKICYIYLFVKMGH